MNGTILFWAFHLCKRLTPTFSQQLPISYVQCLRSTQTLLASIVGSVVSHTLSSNSGSIE